MISLVIGSRPDNDARYRSNLVDYNLNPIRKWLVTPMIFVSF